MLYASPDVTNELIKTGRYESTLHRLKPELDANWHAQLGDLPPVSVFDSDGDTFTDEELMEIRWRIEFDYVRCVFSQYAISSLTSGCTGMPSPCEPPRTASYGGISTTRLSGPSACSSRT